MARNNPPSNKKKSSGKTRVRPSSRRNADSGFGLIPRKWHLWIIGLFAFALYANTLFHQFTQDDAIVIYDNMFTTDGIGGIPGLLKYDTFYGFFKEAGKSQLVAGGRYRPLTPILFALEWELFGKSPFIGHLLNILFYALTCIVLYLTLLKLFKKNASQSFVFSLIATLLFAAHPIHTEVVANIKGRDEICCLLFSLLALFFALKNYKNDHWKFGVLGGICLFLGLLSKENAITFLGVIPLALWLFKKSGITSIAKSMIPFMAAAIGFLIIRGEVIGWNFGDSPMELMNNPFVKWAGNQYVDFSFAEKSSTILHTLGKYVQLLFVPHPLTHDYYPRHIDIMSWTQWTVLLSMVVYVALTFVAVRSLKSHKLIAFGIFFFLMTLSIVSNVFFPVGTNMSERFLFMPSVGFSIALVSALFILEKRFPNFKSKRLTLSIAAVILLLFSVKTITRNAVWKDNYTLFTTDIKTSKNSAKLCNAVGGELSVAASTESNADKKTKLLHEAIVHLNKAVEIHPLYKNAHLQLGNCNHYLEQYNQAISFFNKALKLDPSYKDAISNLGITYRASKQFDVSIQQFEKFAKAGGDTEMVKLHKAQTYEEAGKHYSQLGDHATSISHFKKGLEQGVDNAKFTYFVGIAYAQIGDGPNAISWLKKALTFDIQDDNKKHIYNTLGEVYQSLGDLNNANTYFVKAGGQTSN